MNKNNLLNQWMRVLVYLSLFSQGLLAITSVNADKDREELLNYLQTQQEHYKKHFDKEMLLEELDYDAEKIINFVTNKIVYQAYDGIMRGVQGTLIGRAGNAHDQALTLASMLNDADVEAQIMVGKLTKIQIDALNKHIASPILPKVEYINKTKQPKMIQDITSNIQSQVHALNEESIKIYEQNEEISQYIYDNLSQEALTQAAKVFKDTLDKSTQSYRWVRYKKPDSDIWVEIHPAYMQANEWNLKAHTIEAGSVNQNDLQKLSIELFIENSNNEKHSITGKWSVPAANLTGRPITIEVLSDAMINSKIEDNLTQNIDQGKYFFVKINNEFTKSAKVFDHQGQLHTKAALSGTYKTTANLGSKFANALSFEGETKKTPPFLKKVWLEFTIEKPNTKPRTIYRQLFKGNAQNTSEYISLALQQEWNMLVSTTKAILPFYQKERTSHSINEVNFIQNLDTEVNHGNIDDNNSLNYAAKNMPNRSLAELLDIQSHFDKVKFPNTVSYTNEINLLALRKGYTHNNNVLKFYITSDILSNERLSFVDTELKPSILTTIKHGVWETYAEQSRIIKNKTIEQSKNAFKELTNTKTPLIQTETFKPLLKDYTDKAWWQVNTQTGNTIGMTKLYHGYGGASSVEYLTLVNNIAMTVSTVFLLNGLKDCASQTTSNSANLCCVGINSALWLVGLYGGGVAEKITRNSARAAAYSAGAARGAQAARNAGEAARKTGYVISGVASIGFDYTTSKAPAVDFCNR